MTKLKATLRGRNAIINVFELWIAFAAVIGSSWFFIDDQSLQRTAISAEIGHGLAEIWNACYFVAGAVVLYGLIRPSPRFEVAGLSVLGSTTAINGVAIISVFGGRGFATAATLLTLTAASWVRAYFVFRETLQLAKENGHAASGD